MERGIRVIEVTAPRRLALGTAWRYDAAVTALLRLGKGFSPLQSET
jgi:hypothetical protein